jgi:hypothetical protein
MTARSGGIQTGQIKRLLFYFIYFILFRVIKIPNGQAFALAFARP